MIAHKKPIRIAVMLTAVCCFQMLFAEDNHSNSIQGVNVVVTFHDANIERGVRELVGKPTGDITSTDLATINGFFNGNDQQTCNYKNISDLTGLEYMININGFEVEHNNISDIGVAANWTKMTVFMARYNNVSDITPLQGRTTLGKILLDYNNVSDITAIQNLTNLTHLYLDYNPVYSISVVQYLTKLKVITFSGSNVTDLSPLQNLSSLISIWANGIPATNFSVLSGLTNLTGLHLESNNLSDISFLSGLTNIQNLYLYGNNLDNGDLPSLYALDALAILDLRNNPAINSQAAVQALADNLNGMDYAAIQWDGPTTAPTSSISSVNPNPANTLQTVTVQATATDPESDNVQMKIDWGDGNVSSYSGIQASGSTFTFTHIYSSGGTFNIKVMAKDDRLLEGGWSTSQAMNVSLPTAYAPSFDPAAGTYRTAQDVTISCSTSGATIRYTTNGSDPAESDAAYGSPVHISTTTTLKAKAYKSGYNASATASAAYTITGKVATPAFNPQPGNYGSAQSVTITCTTSGATIRYTTNGTTPDGSSAVYSSALSVSSSMTLKAKAFKSDWDDSDVASGTYTITINPNQVDQPKFLPLPGVYTTAQYITISCGTAGAQIRYTTDGSDPDEQDLLYAAAVHIADTTELKAKGFKAGMTASEVASGTYYITGKVKTPVFDPPPGGYSAPQSVAIACSTASADIHYTTDGSDPVETDSLYKSPIMISDNTTLKARAFKAGWDTSDVAMGIYTIIPDTVETPVFNPPPDTYAAAQEVEITCPTAGAIIHFTTSGVDPAETDPIYSTAVSMDSTTTLKARGFKSGLIPSQIVSGVYWIIPPGADTTEAPVFDPPPGKFDAPVFVKMKSGTEGAVIHYSTDGNDPAVTDPICLDSVLISETADLKARAYKTDWHPSIVVSGTYTIEISDTGSAATPVFSPLPDTFYSPIHIKLSCATAGAVIHFSTNGADPTESDTVYGDSIQIFETTSLKARAYKSGMNPSAVAEGNYIIRIPSIKMAETPSAMMGQALVLSATVTNIAPFHKVILYYKKGGAAGFDTTSMRPQSADAYKGTIPVSEVTERGVECMVGILEDGKAVHRTDTLRIQVGFTGLPCPYATPDTSYRMISVPADPDVSTVFSVLEDDLGKPDRSRWRLLRKHEGKFEEYGIDASFEGFEPGNAFWLITQSGSAWDAGAGRSTSTQGNFILILHPGWNQIGCPFAFPVSWSSVIKHGDVEAPVGYEGMGNQPAGYKYRQTRLEPWKGYYVKNLKSQNITIEIPPIAESGVPGKAGSATIAGGLKPGEWVMRVQAESDGATDEDNWIGVLSDASEEWDANDFSEVPPFGNYLSVFFPHGDWRKYPGEYAGDFRQAVGNSWTWPIAVRSNMQSEIRLSVGRLEGLSSEYGIRLRDEASGAVTDFRGKGEYRFTLTGGGERRLEMTVGLNLEIEEKTAVPRAFTLLQNYPNPFNPETRIPFDVPEPAQVTVVIRDTNGKTVITLSDGVFNSGRHEVIWRGRDESGATVPSGIYTVRLTAGTYTAVRKMIFLK